VAFGSDIMGQVATFPIKGACRGVDEFLEGEGIRSGMPNGKIVRIQLP
jgi:hypothetical protein